MKTLITLLRPAFDLTLNNSFQVALLVVLVLLVQKVLGRWLTPRLRYALSLLILLRLVLLAAPPSPLSLQNLWPRATSPAAPPAAAPTVVEPISPPAIHPEPLPLDVLAARPVATPAALPPPRRLPVLSLAETLALAWACGLVALVALAVWRYVQWCRLIRRGRRLSDTRWLALLDEAREVMGVRRPVTLVAIPQLASPAVFGVWRIRLLLPETVLDQFTDQDWRLLFLHEMAHVRRYDTLLNLLLMAVQFVHWFNPLAWLGLHRLRADRELVCDAMVLQRTRPEERLGYGELLLKLLTDFPAPQAIVPTAVPVVSSKRDIKRRLVSIKHYRSASLAACVATGMTAVTLACLTFTGSSQQPPVVPESAARPAVTNGSVSNALSGQDGTVEERLKASALVRDGAVNIKSSPGLKILEKKITIHLANVPLDTVLLNLSTNAGVNIVADKSLPALTNRLSVKLDEVKLGEVFRYLSSTYDLEFHVGGEMVWVADGKAQQKAPEETRSYRLRGSRQVTPAQPEGTNNAVMRFADLERAITNQFKGMYMIDYQRGLVVARGSPEQLDVMAKIIRDSGLAASLTPQPLTERVQAPTLRSLAWRNEWQTNQPGAAWHPDSNAPGLLQVDSPRLKWYPSREPTFFILRSKGEVVAELRALPGTTSEVSTSGRANFNQETLALSAENGASIEITEGTRSVTARANQIQPGPQQSTVDWPSGERAFLLKAGGATIAELRVRASEPLTIEAPHAEDYLEPNADTLVVTATGGATLKVGAGTSLISVQAEEIDSASSLNTGDRVREPASSAPSRPISTSSQVEPSVQEKADQLATLRFLAWRNEWQTNQAGAAWHTDGSPVTDGTELDWLRQVKPADPDSRKILWAVQVRVGSSTVSLKYRALYLWFSCPSRTPIGFDRLHLLDEAGRDIPSWGPSPAATSWQEPDDRNGGLGWSTACLLTGDALNVPPHVTVRLDYTSGPLERVKELAITPDLPTLMPVDDGAAVKGYGQDAKERAFIIIAVDEEKNWSRRFDVVAVGKDGREITSVGRPFGDTAKAVAGAVKFEFDLPLASVARFRIGSRAVRTRQWSDVVMTESKMNLYGDHRESYYPPDFRIDRVREPASSAPNRPIPTASQAEPSAQEKAEQLATLRKHLQNLQEFFKDGYPLIQTLKDQIQKLEEQQTLR